MLRLDYKSYDFPFEYPFAISKGIKTHQPSLVVTLSMGNVTGYGEATAISYYGVTVAAMIEELERGRNVIERYALISPERFWHFLHHLFPGNNFLVSALDMAAWDIWARLKRQPLWKLLGFEWNRVPATDYTIGITAPEEIPERIKEKPYPIYKLKVGSEHDLQALEILRKNTDAIIRVDANEAWTLETAKYIGPYLEKWKIELIEQPLHRDDTDGLKILRTISKIPIIADEACRDEKDLPTCLDLHDGINIKLSKCGGITPALRMIKIIQQAGKKVMLGGMCENTVGATALANLLPAADYADIDGPLLLTEPIGSGLQYLHGSMSLPGIPGSGFTI